MVCLNALFQQICFRAFIPAGTSTCRMAHQIIARAPQRSGYNMAELVPPRKGSADITHPGDQNGRADAARRARLILLLADRQPGPTFAPSWTAAIAISVVGTNTSRWIDWPGCLPVTVAANAIK